MLKPPNSKSAAVIKNAERDRKEMQCRKESLMKNKTQKHVKGKSEEMSMLTCRK